VLREQASGYRVEGEIGRFDFPLYEAVNESKRVVCRGVDFFPRRRPREWHKTEGFREEALCLEASRRSYRDNGYKSLQNTIMAFFAWPPRVWLRLDGYHLVKKFKEGLSLACRGRIIRNQHLGVLVRLLWYGLVSEARQYLAAIRSLPRIAKTPRRLSGSRPISSAISRRFPARR
jgi:hypothetical protein